MQPPQMLGYDRAITVFSPQGRLYQVEYAREAVKKGTVSLGIVFKNGVLLGADKNITENLMVPGSIEKVYQIDEHIGAATSGLVADGRRIVDRCRIIAQSHRITFDEAIPVDSLTKEICDFQQLHTQISGVRPFGTALLIAGFNDGPRLFETDPSGSFWEYKAAAIGEGSDKVMEFFNREYQPNLTLEDAVTLALRALSKNRTGGVNERSIELAYILKNKNYHKATQEELKKYLQKITSTKSRKQ